MTFSEIQITFVIDLIAGNQIGFVANGGVPVYNLDHKARWVDIRTGIDLVPIGTPIATPGTRSAINFAKAFNIDHNPSMFLFEVVQTNNVVYIRCKVPGIDFSNAFTIDDYLLYPAGGNADVTFVINNYGGVVLGIDSVIFQAATTNPVCTHYKVQVTTSILADKITSPVQVDPNIANPFTFEILRGQSFVLSCELADGQLVNQTFNINQVPDLLNSANISIQITNSPNGATILAVVTSQYSDVSLEYSLTNNGVDWQSENVFSGILDGDYTLYVKDTLGCIAQLDFTVSEGNVVEPFFYISKSMSIRYAARVIYGDCGPYKNDDNTLSCEAFAKDQNLAHKEIQQFQSCDSIKTQFMSNYDTLTVKVIKEDGTEDALIINKLTNYIGRKDMRDAMKYNLGNNQTGIHFTSGNLYNYDTEVDTDNDYILNGGLPEWAVVGNWLSIGGAWFEIVNNIFDPILGEVLVIDAIYLGAPTIIQVKSKYNRQKFEVYDFTVPMATYNNQIIKVQFNNVDAVFPDLEHISEDIKVLTRHDDTIEIKYYNPNNTDVFYKSGIINLLRIPIENILGDHEDDSENLKADNKSDLLNATVYELDEFVFEPVTKGIYRKLVQALSHKFITLDGVAYIKNGSIDKEGPLEDSNLYVVSAKMLKTIAPYNANIVGIEPDIINNENTLEMPNLIITDNGEFISYSE